MTQAIMDTTITRKSSVPREPKTGSAHRMLRNGAFNLAVQGLYAVFYLVIIASLARGLGKEGFGEYYTLFALMLVVQAVCEVGVSTVLTRRLARSPETWRATMSEPAALFTGIVLASVGVFLGLGVLGSWLRGDATLWPCFALAGLACAAMQVQRFCAAVFAAFELFAYENLARILQGASLAGAVSVLAWQGTLRLAMVFALLAASHVLSALFLIASLTRHWCSDGQRRKGEAHPSRLTPRTASVKNWLAESVPLGLGDVLRGLCWQLDTVLLGLLQPAAVVGIYSVAYRPLGPINWIPLSILTAVFPAFARTAESNRGALQHMFAASMRLLWIASLPIAVFFCIGAERVILLIAGPEYVEAAQPMRVVIWITSLSFLSYPFRFLFAALGRARLYAVLVLLTLTSQATIAVTLIPRWGYWGACTGSLLAETFFTTAGLILCGRLSVGGIAGRALAGAAIAAVGMAALLWPARNLPLPLLALAAVGATGIYLVLCVLLGALRRQEVRRFVEALGLGGGSNNLNSVSRPSQN